MTQVSIEQKSTIISFGSCLYRGGYSYDMHDWESEAEGAISRLSWNLIAVEGRPCLQITMRTKALIRLKSYSTLTVMSDNYWFHTT